MLSRFRAASRLPVVERQLPFVCSARLFSDKPVAASSNPEKLMRERLQNATGMFPGNPHRSNAEELIAGVPVIVVQADVAVCDGGGGVLGHPVEYIQLNKKKDEPETCKYCGLRYQKDPHYHGGH